VELAAPSSILQSLNRYNTDPKQFVDQLGQACIGTISEIFDAEPPFTPRGCVSQAWSVAEALRCWQQATAPMPQLPGPAESPPSA
jgi:glycogen debranching enzyme